MNVVESFREFANEIRDSINSCLPAKVVAVNEDGSVNVVLIRNDKIGNCVITVPVLRPETQRAYIQLAIKTGDRGVVKFCDRSIEDYRLTGSDDYNGDDRMHSISDGVFQLGFLPDTEKFIYPEGEIVIGLKDQTFTLSVDEQGNLTMTAPSVTINSPITIEGDVNVNGTITASTDVIGGGISLKGHVHGGVSSGGSTTGAPQ